VVTGSSAEGAGEWYASPQPYTAKYAAADGAVIWESRDGYSTGTALAMDGDGNVLVTGTAGGPTGASMAGGNGLNGWGIHTAKYAAADGAVLWRRGAPGGEVHVMGFWNPLFAAPSSAGNSHSLAVGPNGKVAIACSSDGAGGPGGSLDYTTVLYSGIPGPASFAAWAEDFGLSGNNAAPDADPDRDGLPNAAEYVFGGDPLAPSATARPTATIAGENMSFTFPRDDRSETSDVFLVVETSTDLVTWRGLQQPAFNIGIVTESSTYGVTVNENRTAPDTITVAIPMETDKAKFARLKISVTP
jgi:hypothetical protein